jgi:carbonic anhydrase
MTQGSEKEKPMFCTAINCMDGRTQLTVINYLQKHFGVVHVDMITEAGPNKILAEGVDANAVRSIQRRIDISVNKHGSVGMAIVGHEDCGGNPAEKPQQLEQLKAARAFLQETYPDVPRIALWVDLKGNVEELE